MNKVQKLRREGSSRKNFRRGTDEAAVQTTLFFMV